MRKVRRGASLIDVIISLGIVVFLFGGIYLVYFSLQDSIANIDARTAATTVLGQEMEVIRDMPYDSVGVVGGIPSGVIPPQQAVSLGNYTFTVQTTARNIDDPFDGVLGGNPNDTAPSDYKLLTLTASCPSCINNFIPLSITTTIAPKNLESAGRSGDLFINVIDSGLWTGFSEPVPYANVRVTNSYVTPTVDFTDTTNASGVLQLVGVPTSTLSYHVVVTKDGYSSDRTYPIGAPENPNPKKKDATVSEQTVTGLTFQIDKMSKLNVHTRNNTCGAIGNVNFSIQGSEDKVIGTDPTVYKFSTSSITDADGNFSFPGIEWDTYTLAVNGSSYNLAGTIPLNPLVINPSSTVDFMFVMRPAANLSLLVTVADVATGAGVEDASVNISKTDFFAAQTTGHAVISESDWSGTGGYSSQDGGIDPSSNPGSLVLMRNASGTYDTGVTHWLISATIDLGSSSSTLYSLSWNPASQPPSTGLESAKFQLAANNDNATWNFVGPNGTAGTYYTASSTISGLDNNRYIRYEVFLSTEDTDTSPSVDDVTIEFNSICVPPGQVIFTNLSSGIYTVDVMAPQYNEATTSVSVASNYQQTTLQLVHQ